MDLTEMGWKGVNWINLAQDRDKRRAVVCKVLNFRVPQNPGNLFTNSGTNSSREGLFSMQFVSQSVMFDYASAQQDGALYTALLAVPH
jgi:hypothetical protein